VTVVPPEGPPLRQPHLGELRLRRFRAGELPPDEAAEVEAHAAACGTCRVRLRALDDEQRTFERAVPFERFAGGVERAQRVPRRRPRPAFYAASAGLAALVALVFVWVAPRPTTPNRIKGGDVEARLQVAAESGEQQALAPGERLALRPRERIRIGIRSAGHRHLGAVSIDDLGEVTPLYPERGAALPLGPSTAMTYLPDSLEFTGQGRERVFLLLAPASFAIEDLVEIARAAYQQAHANLEAMDALPTEGEQFTWLLLKP
jgi:hypothetical protein